MERIRAASAQFNHRAVDKAYNLRRVREMAAEAKSRGVGLLAFPEMCLTGYWHVRNLSRDEIDALAESTPDGPTSRELLALAAKLDMTIGAGLIERASDGTLYNTYVVAMPNGEAACHRKIHCFISEHMASGDAYTVFNIPQGARVGVLTCYDNNIIENVRMTALQGAEILVAPHQTGGCGSLSPGGMRTIDPALWHARESNPEAIEAELRGPNGREWLLRWLPSRAHDNGLFLLFANGVGVDDDEVRTGNSMILDPYGRILTETWRAADDLVVADLDPELLVMSTGGRWMQSRRPSLYGPIAEPTGNERDTRVVRFTKT